MNLFPSLEKKYTEDNLSAREAQRLAEFIAWGPVVFQASRLMVKFGILDALRDNDGGLTEDEVVEKIGLSKYAVKCLLEASLCIGTVIVDTKTDKYTISKTGWFLLNDQATKVNMDFNHDVNYEGWFNLEESLKEGRPAGLKHFGDWPTIYEGLSSLPEHVQKSWFGFDHFYSDSSFPEALEIVFKKHTTRSLYDVGGNTGKWALQCVGYDKDVEVTILDLPQQIGMMKANVAGKEGADRIYGHGINLLDDTKLFPQREGGLDAIWMSQFLDCFSEEQIVSILTRAKAAMTSDTRLYIMETLWDRQRFEPAAFCLTMTSLYFTALANGNSKMYHSEDMIRLIDTAGLHVEDIYDGLGQGHSIIVCRK
ncbi:MAG: SAM-dependent methyltransferase [Bacteroidaceae bacterium]|nr:SAM-dependent methyltransferase [Bacteroidaceae bacterium]